MNQETEREFNKHSGDQSNKEPEPGTPYKGVQTTRHPAQFDADLFRVVPADELEKLRADTKVTRRQKYPFPTMEVGEEWKVPMGSAIASVRSAAESYGRSHKRLYVVRKTPAGNYTVVRLE